MYLKGILYKTNATQIWCELQLAWRRQYSQLTKRRLYQIYLRQRTVRNIIVA
jgi:hypothetical protein